MPSALGLLRRAAQRDPARPRLTWYDDASGERVELSGATLLNWVAKTAHLMSGELGLGPGDRLAVDLPRHWTAAVCWLAADAVGARLTPVAARQTLGSGPDVAVVGPDGLPGPSGAGEVVAVSLRPMGGPFVDPLPPLVHDFTVQVRAQPDTFPFGPDPSTAAGDAGRSLAAAWQLGPGDRLLVCDGWPASDPVAPDLAAAWAADASVVWVRNAAAELDVERWTAEQVTAVVVEPGPAAGTVLPDTSSGSPIRVLARPSVS
ncbi:MAG: TIGR03089 family protein [Actinomycetota bacterium]|nr:TIGR03089 family protein [Actinomycetota bacterium]MDH4352501.1 TIGR03089 family protein [Actinomycetota bacterium]MDH5278362.1 TIGR03089 family protein [Actinomycetota bacterium]